MMDYTVFGESHGPAIGVVLRGVPSGLELDMDLLQKEMQRRAPGRNGLSTSRKEPDTVEILSGLYRGKTTGTPLCMLIRNSGQHSGDYDALRDIARPGHADYTAFVRYGGCADPRGGGHFSGRLTAPLVAAGAVAKQILAEKSIGIYAHAASVAGIQDTPFDPVHPDTERMRALRDREFAVLDPDAERAMREKIQEAREAGDSVGGVVECLICGLAPGFGGPDLGDNAEGIFSRHLFAVPAVKGIEFGEGFGFAELRGSQANDPFRMENGEIRTATNRNGGINGGITNGMPVLFRVVIKPTPSIAIRQQTVDFRRRRDTEIEIRGRHDPCIVPRAVVAVEAAAALAACELLRI